MTPIQKTLDASILSLPPFIQVQGVINIRMVGGYKTAMPSTIVEPGIVFRSGELSGKKNFISHGIGRIFDFHSDTEGVTTVRAVISEPNVFDPASLTLRGWLIDLSFQFVQTFLEVYEEILTFAGLAFNAILRHLFDNPEEPVLILGVDDQDIVNYYALATHGLEPAIPLRTPTFCSNFEGAARDNGMVAMLQMIREKFGGAEGYVKKYNSIDDEDIEMLRRRLLVAV
ncbi:uncharacterized protein BT62DRAFT_985312 [Guyanagaster necrorhizus]|uniref:Uncharacterized protein n=1 Tax=Guyanagaster necrorhizus TaxID=856835 RepID=A0A9P8AW83_9AGAR|nr:uncharacterized protein BT62DRAFT_985312 [Guyanagaster necrorhizus MCA 3950]KAG7449901.1 hypothetical protein BT62DRAFT_985312 [Guyanagaster necrorhizus MCA 3950]